MPRETTMKVKLTTGRAWCQPDGKTVAADPGDEITVDAAEGRRLLESGQAEPVAAKPSSRAEKR
jgi:hypothetical protein